MSSINLLPSKSVRTYKQSDHELSMEIHNELGRLMAVGHCTCLNDYPQIVLNNVCLPVPLYSYEFRRWLNVAIAWCIGDKISANFESDETLFDYNYLD